MMLHYVYVAFHVLLAIIVAEAGWRYFFWWEKRGTGDLRHSVLGVATIAASFELWDLFVIFRGAATRVLPGPISMLVDLGILVGFTLLMVSTWMIDLNLDAWRLSVCAITRTAVAAVVAGILVVAGYSA